MSTIFELISQFKAIADDPKKAMDDFKKETGKGAVGIMPVYCPEEIVHAAGYLPIGMWGAQGKQISKARTLLPPFACSIMQSVMELQLEGAYDELDAVIFSVPCDTLKCMSQKWKGSAPQIVFTHPQNRKHAQTAANVFCRAEYAHIKEELEDILGVKITKKALQNSIAIYNENRAACREFSDLVAANPGLIKLRDRHAVIKARWFMPKEKHTAMLKELNEAIKAADKAPFNGKKVVVSGITLEPYDVLDIFEENGGCSLATDADKPKGGMLIDALKKYDADAVIVCMMKFCDPEEFDYPILLLQFEEAGVKHIQVEIDQESTSFEQLRTRIQTFAEVL